MMKRTLLYILMLLLIMQPLAAIVVGPREANAAPSGGGSGDEDDPYVILTPEDLSDIRNDPTAYYILGGNIDLEGYDEDGDGHGWKPIEYFGGYLDGNGYVIRNMTINRSGESEVGFIAYFYGELSRIQLLDVDVAGRDYVGGLAGTSYGSFVDSYVTGSIKGSNSRGTTLGGLAGSHSSGLIDRSYSSAVVAQEDGLYVGGLVGWLDGEGEIRQSYATGCVTGDSKVGGLVGWLDGGGEIRDSYATGCVTGNSRVGGLVGESSDENNRISTSYSTGYVTGGSEVGGLIGFASHDIGTNSFWDTESSHQPSSAGGLETGKTSEEMKTGATFTDANWDFAHTWAVIEGTTSPMFIRNFDAVKLDGISVSADGASADWDRTFAAQQGIYTITIDQPVPSVDIDVSVDPAQGAAVRIDGGDPGASKTVALTPGMNDVLIEVTGADGVSKGVYRLRLMIPEPSVTMTDLMVPDDGTYGKWSTLSFIVSYDQDVTVTGTPMLEIITSDTGGAPKSVYAEYIGQPAGRSDRLIFEYNVPPGLLDADGIRLGNTIVLPSGASITASGQAVTAVLPPTDTTGVRINSKPPVIALTQTPAAGTPTGGAVTVAAKIADSGGAITEMKWAQGAQSADYFTIGGTPFTGDSFEVSMNDTYTVYALDEYDNDAIATIDIGNINSVQPSIHFTTSPSAITNGPVTVTVTAAVYGEPSGNSLIHLRWLAGSRSAADFSGGAVGDGIISDGKFSVTANGTYTVYARDAAANEAVKEIEIANIRKPEPDDDDDDDDSGRPNRRNSSFVPVATEALPVITGTPDGGIMLVIDSSGIVKEASADGTAIEKVALTDELIERVLESLETADKPFVTVRIHDSEQAVQVQFPASSLDKAKASYPDAIFEMMLEGSSFQLQIDVLHLEQLADQLGVDLQQMQVNVMIRQVTGQEKEQLERIAGNQGLGVIGEAVEYRLTVSAGEQTIEIRDFGGTYMVRGIVLDAGLSNPRLMAVLYEPAAQTFSFVPGVLATRDEDRQEMSMSVPHNSIYALVEAANKSFSDLNGHWAKQDVELMASRLIVRGVSDTRFAPNNRITRAEFTALLVRALGIRVEDRVDNAVFRDVAGGDWYAPAIEAGVRAGLVGGMSSDRFAPNSEITREQMAVMIANALSMTGKPEPGADPDRATSILAKFSDRSDISAWARSAVARSVAAGIIDGVSADTMAPSEHATRAQAAVMLKRLLQYIAFMD